MATRPYYQRADSGRPVAADTTVHSDPPRPLRALVLVFGALSVILLALPVVMSVDREFVQSSVLHERPDLNGSELDVAITSTRAFTWLTHVATVLLGAWLVRTVLRGRAWARIALTVLLVLATANSIDSALTGPQYYAWVIGSDLCQLGMLLLLWLPRSVRTYLGRGRRKDPRTEAGAGSTPTGSGS